MIRFSRLRRGSVVLVIAGGLAAGCGNVPPTGSPPGELPGPSAPATAPAPATATVPASDKPMPSFEQAWLAGWLGGAPVVASYATPGDDWTISVLRPGGWSQVGTLPAGSRPVADGVSVANVVDPAVATAVAVLGDHGTTQVPLPDDAWRTTWTGVAGLEPLAGGGYLLRGAGGLATISPDAELDVAPVPAGFVALSPTAVEGTWLLATKAATDDPGALSESTPFAVYLWRDRDPTAAPVNVLDEVTLVTPSSSGLAMLRRSDGSWWRLGADGVADEVAGPSGGVTRISPDGAWLATLDGGAGCDRLGTMPCPVAIAHVAGGATSEQAGPAAGLAFDGDQVAAVLSRRDPLHLPWRVLVGPVEHPTVVPLE